MHMSSTTARDKMNGAPQKRGVAIVTVLAIMTILALLAVSFIVLVEIERMASTKTMAMLQARLVAASAREHALAILANGSGDTPGCTHPGQAWRTTFGGSREPDIDGQNGITNMYGAFAGARWFDVRTSGGTLVGRYAVIIEDEAGKLNINAAAATGTNGQNQGVSTAELLLADGGDRGLPLSVAGAQRILDTRYGADRRPGIAGRDDNFNAAGCVGDEIDNDANGMIDEHNEGIDEPEEFAAQRPQGDDRPFSAMQDLELGVLPELRAQPGLVRQLASLTTTRSRNHEMYWDERDGAWHPQLNINAASGRQYQRMLNRANTEQPFEPNSRNLRGLTANLMDYRDYNHSLSTVGSEYGVEAVSFSEIMANDYSIIKEIDHEMVDASDTEFIHRLGYWYNPWTHTEYDDANKQERYGWKIQSMGGNHVTLGDPSDSLKSLNHFKQFQDCLAHDGWPKDIFKNAALWFRYTNGSGQKVTISFTITKSDERNTLYINSTNAAFYNILQTYANQRKPVRIETFWHCGMADWCVLPEQSDKWYVPNQKLAGIVPPKDYYYYVHVYENCFGGSHGISDRTINDGTYSFSAENYYNSRFPGTKLWKGYCNTIDMDGDPSRYTESEMDALTPETLRGTTLKLRKGVARQPLMRFVFNERKAVRARNGLVPFTVTSSRDCGTGRSRRTSGPAVWANKHTFDAVGCIRPDIIELTNIGDRPVSLRNWRVVINTGSYADQVGLIENAPHYSMTLRAPYNDPNPVLEPRGCFYLSNNRSVFANTYGQPANDVWGDSQEELYPCAEIPDYLWGVRYEVRRITGNTATVKGADWKVDQMRGEIIEFRANTPLKTDRNDFTGWRKYVVANGKDTLNCGNLWLGDTVRAGDDVIILGLPRSGGFISMTIKNEYDQIVARTIEYGSTKLDEFNTSTEKIDPTHYTWVKSSPPTFGGNQRKALNRAVRASTRPPAHVKNNNFVSVGEFQQVRTAKDWENVGQGAGKVGKTKMLRAVAPFTTVSGIRLDPEEPKVHQGGWKPAFATTKTSSSGSISANDASWSPNRWNGQTLRMLSGKLRGESFRIISNSVNSIVTDGYSNPGGKQLRPEKEDMFAVGPGYVTAFFCTTRNGDEGIWEWNRRGVEKAPYGLYVFGLNDSINTTEFLEENNNAKMEVHVFNYVTRTFDQMPLRGAGGAQPLTGNMYAHPDPISQNAFRYDKNDGMYCGMIGPDHVSIDGGIKLRLIPRALDSPGCSGMAWFDYAYLAPATVPGKININTASPRVLTSLVGVSPALARNIAAGATAAAARKLKPYRSIGDILDVNGMTEELFSRNANLMTVYSDQFRIRVRAEAVKDANGDGSFSAEKGDRVTAVIDQSSSELPIPSAR